MTTKFQLGSKYYLVQMNEKQINEFYSIVVSDVENQKSSIQLGMELLTSGKLDKALSLALVPEGEVWSEEIAVETLKDVARLNVFQKYQILAEILNQTLLSFGTDLNQVHSFPLNTN